MSAFFNSSPPAGLRLPISWRLRVTALIAALALAAPLLPSAPTLAEAAIRHNTAKARLDTAKARLETAARRAALEAARKQEAAFREFVSSLWPLAEARGVSRAIFDSAFAGVAFDPAVVAHTTNQAEFVEPIWVYLANAVSPERVKLGSAKAQEQHVWLAKAEETYGVDPAILLGVWGMESAFGAFSGSDGVVRSLASLAFVHFRGDYFRGELISALVILQKGDIAAREMKGSWAGAMGQTQFMPSSFLDYAVDFEGHGRRDIWGSAPDAIGSTANYLARHGWVAGLPWGFEVHLPGDFKLAVVDQARLSPFAAFAARGVTRIDGAPLPSEGEARLLIPAGLNGPIFLVTANFRAIRAYNDSTAYALGVALLGGAATGAGAVTTPWPTRDKPLAEKDVREMQRELRRRGFDVGELDGHAGEQLAAALRAYQESIGAPPDGYPTLALLRRLRERG
jgi:membrane-bound lytic murein transglycosylase B